MYRGPGSATSTSKFGGSTGRSVTLKDKPSTSIVKVVPPKPKAAPVDRAKTLIDTAEKYYKSGGERNLCNAVRCYEDELSITMATHPNRIRIETGITACKVALAAIVSCKGPFKSAHSAPART